MTQYYWLRATDEDAMNTALAALTDIPYADISVIGIWYENTGTADAPVMTAKPGYHANVASRDPLPADVLAQLPVIDKPATPWRIWLT